MARYTPVHFLWYNVVGAVTVFVVGMLLTSLRPRAAARMTAPATPAAGRVGPDGWVLVVALALATLLPLSDAVGRPLGFHISGSAAYLQQVTLWLTFVGGLVATRHRTTSPSPPRSCSRATARARIAGLLAACVAAAVLAVLAYSGVSS